MGRQINKDKVLEEKGELKQYTLFREFKSDKLDWLLDAYKQDPYKARVLFFNSRPDCFINRDVCFERTDGSFEICSFRRKFGMSKTNRIYSREKKTMSLIYKNKKFYFKNGTSLKHAMYTDIHFHFGFAYKFLEEKFTWFRNIKENKYCHNISLSSVMTYKLFNADKVLKHLYKAPSPVINVLTKQYEEKSKSYGHISKNDWKRISPYLTNIENLNVELFTNHLFRDTIETAIKLNKKINCSWSNKRLKLEHDTWAKELRKIMLEFEPVIQLNPHKIFEDFEKFTGYNMLRTNHELIEEGHRQDHCVAGYGSSVSSGYSGIYQVSGYTLEVNYSFDYDLKDIIVKNPKALKYSQIRGFRNCSPPKELDDTVRSYIKAFNDKYDFDEYEKHLKINKSLENYISKYANELPF
jgi:hypothetical protein